MFRAMNTAATGMEAQQTKIDVIANNLANVNTTGYKQSRAEFQDLMYQVIRPTSTSVAQGVTSPNGLQVGLGSKVVSTVKSFSMGDLKNTGDPLNMAIAGEGLFEVQVPNSNQVAYTRSGNFQLDSQGRVVTMEGYLLNPPLSVPLDAQPSSIRIAGDGTVTVAIQGQTAPLQIGQIQIALFANYAGLEPIGQNLYRASDAAGPAVMVNPTTQNAGHIEQKFLETSNVKVVEEMVNMIASQRAYEFNAKAIKAAEEMMQQVSTLKS